MVTSSTTASAPPRVIRAFGSLLRQTLSFVLAGGEKNLNRDHDSESNALKPLLTLEDLLSGLVNSSMDEHELANSICDTFQRISDLPLPPEDSDLVSPHVSPVKGERSFTVLGNNNSAESEVTHDQGYKRPSDPLERSPAGKAPSKQARRHLSYPGSMPPHPPQPAPPVEPMEGASFESLAQLIHNSLQSNAEIVRRFEEKAKSDDERLAKLHTDVKMVIDDHSQRLDDHANRISTLEEMTADLQSKLSDFTSRASVSSHPSFSSQREDLSFSQPGSSTPLSFSKAARADVDQRVQTSRETEAKNAKSLVIFHAREHLGDMTDKDFAAQVVGLFDGKYAKVETVEWIGQGQAHLRVTLDKPVAEDVGRSFWQNARTYNVRYSLAPCRGAIFREAINRMRAVLEALRRHSELAGRRVHATAARFIGTDNFEAHKFLYPAIRLSDDRVIYISQIINNPHAPISFTPDATLDIPGPDAAFTSSHY